MLLRYKADRRSVTFVFLYFAFTYIAWTKEMSHWTETVAWIVLLSLLSFFTAVITHNTIHCPIFRPKFLNRWFQVMLSLGYGHPVSAFIPGHNYSHHKYLETDKDIMRTTKARYKINFFNQAFFFFIMSNSIMRDEIKFAKAMRTKRPAWFRQYIVEMIITFGVKIGLIVLNPLNAVLFLIIPNLYASWGIVSTNFWQHDGADATHQYNHSRSFTGKVLNYFAFNNGYHGAHHMRPRLHWSLLPEWHKKNLEPYCHPNLSRVSLVKYLIEQHISPGIRTNYLGEPIVLPPETEDEDWVATAPIEKRSMAVSG